MLRYRQLVLSLVAFMVAFMVAFCWLSNVEAKNTASKIKSKYFAKLLTQSQILYLDEINKNIQKSHSIRMFKVPYYGDGNETELIYGYDVYLGVSELDEHPDFAVFYLGKIGEIEDVQWKSSGFDGKKDISKITLITKEYSTEYNKYYHVKRNSKKRVELSISVDSVEFLK